MRMTLENLLKTKQLKPHKTTRDEVRRHLAVADRALHDAALPQASPETRFDAAYRAVMQCALVALAANGYRLSTNVPGHHQTAIQTLPKTIGLSADRILVLDTLRRKRNRSDYEGDPVEDAAIVECAAAARQLLADVRAWLRAHQPDLL